MQFKGTVHRYGRDVDTDVIIPARYLTTSEPSELAKHCMEDLDADFVNKVQQGDIKMCIRDRCCSILHWRDQPYLSRFPMQNLLSGRIPFPLVCSTSKQRHLLLCSRIFQHP